jgi:predicted site-specific integrase-resolvase
MNIPAGFLTTKEALKYIPVHNVTLRKWAQEGKIETRRAPGRYTRRFYNVRKFLLEKEEIQEEENAPSKPPQKSYCYCRVSSNGQRDDLKRQVAFMQERYPEHIIIQEVGSGLNFKRRGLQRIIDAAIQGGVKEVVVAYKDRLCRFGFDLIEHLIQEHSGGTIVVLQQTNRNQQEELVSDLLSIITVFSARVNGLRKYNKQIREDPTVGANKNKKTEVLPNQQTKENTKGMDGELQVVL